jgi:mannan endo-1,4-beta-mannosidase
VNSAKDMAARAQVIRAYDYAMAGRRVPPHAVPPRPAITSAAGERVYWQGSAGAKNYSIQKGRTRSGPWLTVCSRCVTDSSNGYALRAPAAGWYRVIPYNLDGRAGPPSAATANRAPRAG